MKHSPTGRAGRHFNYSNVMSTIAVFLVIAGGTALAAALPKNSVKSKTVKDNSLKTGDLKNGKGVSGADVVNDSLEGADVDESTLNIALPSSLPPSGAAGGDLSGSYPSPILGPSSVGTTDLAGAAVTSAKLADQAVTTAKLGSSAVTTSEIADGNVTTSDLGNGAVSGQKLGPIVTREATVTVPPTSSRAAVALCNSNEAVLGGGMRWENADDSFVNLWVLQSHKAFGGVNGWVSRGANPGAAPRNMIASVTCLGG